MLLISGPVKFLLRDPSLEENTSFFLKWFCCYLGVYLLQPRYILSANSLETNESTIPLVDQVKPAKESLEDGMYSLLMGTFDIPAPINYLGSMSVGKSIMTVVNRTNPSLLLTYHEPQVPLSKVEVARQVVLNATAYSIVTPSTSQRSQINIICPPGKRTLYIHMIY